MRQLTASQKIAVLEHRIARLEKQAMLSTIKKSLKDFFKWAKSRLQISIIGAMTRRLRDRPRYCSEIESSFMSWATLLSEEDFPNYGITQRSTSRD